MWTQRQRARHAAHLKEILSQHAVQEVAGWLNRLIPLKQPLRLRTNFVLQKSSPGYCHTQRLELPCF